MTSNKAAQKKTTTATMVALADMISGGFHLSMKVAAKVHVDKELKGAKKTCSVASEVESGTKNWRAL